MMGMPLTPEQQRAVDEKVAARKAKVAESLVAQGIDPDRHAGHEHQHVPVEPVEVEDAEGVGEELVFRYIRTRQEAIDKLRAQVRSLDGRIRHLESQLALSEKKNAALRDALAKAREARKAVPASAEEGPAE